MGSSGRVMVPVMAAIVVVVLLLSSGSSEAVTCSDVVKAIKPCVQYLQKGSGTPPPPCCQGASALARSVTSTPDKQTVCGCLKSASKSMKINVQVAKTLPGNCKISFPYPMDPSVDCSTIR